MVKSFKTQDFMKNIGILALASRFQRISDRIMEQGKKVYSALDLDFNPRWFPYMVFLSKHSSTTIGELSKTLRVSHVVASKAVGQMVDHGILSTTKKKNDRRVTHVVTTKKGKMLIKELELVWQDLRRTCSFISDSTGFDTLQFLDQFDQALDKYSIFDISNKLRKEREIKEVEIIEYNSDYRKDFKSLNLEWIEKFFLVEKVDEEVLENPEKYILKPGGYIFLAKMKNKIVGTSALLKMNESCFELTKMSVTPEWQGYKIGQKLMDACIQQAKKSKASKLYLETNSRLGNAVSLYRKVGFKDIESVDKAVYSRADTFLEMTI